MSNAAAHSWDFLSGEEAESAAAIMDALRGAAWAQPLLAGLPDPADLTRNHKAKLFELRFGYALHQAGIAPRYELEGEAGSTIDFGFVSGTKDWRVELMRLEETAAVRRATGSHIDEDGVQRFSRILRTGAEDPTQSPEGPRRS